MDSDLQDPPEIIPDLVAAWRKVYDVVYAKRRARKDTFLKKPPPLYFTGRCSEYLMFTYLKIPATFGSLIKRLFASRKTTGTFALHAWIDLMGWL